MNVSGKTVWLMLFGVAVAFSVDPLAGLFAFFAMLAASNPQRVVQMLIALDDTVQRTQRLLEERGWRALASGDEGEAGEGVTTHHINNKETSVVTPTPTPTPAPTPTASTAVTTARINNTESTVVTLPPPSRFDPNSPRRFSALP